MTAHFIAEEGPHRGLVFKFTEGEDWVIGRDPDVADFVIEDSTVSRQHARITKQPQGIFLQNLSHTNPVLINGEERDDNERVLLGEGDKIQIGHTIFLFSEEDLSSEDTPLEPPSNAGNFDEIFGDLEEPPPPSREAEVTEVDEAETSEESAEEEPTYDTIFEDAEGGSEHPFSLLQPADLLLKVISGPNAGAEIGIEKGRTYVLGKDPNTCDVVFQDLSVSRNHARLSVSEDGVLELEDLGSKNSTLVNGQPTHEKVTVTPQDLISLGTTVFLIIDREAPQETIYSPLLPSYEGSREGGAPIEVDTGETLPTLTQADWKNKPLPTKHLLTAAAFFAIILIISLSFFSLFKSENIVSVQKEPETHIKEALAKYPEVQYSFNPGSGKLFLVGHVLTAVDYQEMLFQLEQVSLIHSLDNSVVIDELVWRSMNDVLNGYPTWRGISIHAPKPGLFIVNGYVQTNEEAMNVWGYLTTNFPYLDRLQNQISIEENLSAIIQGMLIMHQLGGVTFQISGGDLILTGSYAKTVETDYAQFIKQLHAIPGISSVKNFAVATSLNTSGINITEHYQVTGSSIHEGAGYSVVLNGKIYAVGDFVDGMEVTSIDRTMILLEKDGLKYRIDYR